MQLAVAKGATLFERHVGIQTDEYQLNDYSSSPDKVRAWMLAQKTAIEICGSPKRAPASPQEAESLMLLKRGVFARSKIVKGEEIERDQVFFAMPSMEGYLTTTGWRERIVADRDYIENEPLLESLVNADRSEDEYIYQIILQLKGMLMDARIELRPESTIELSHHYGLMKFREFGAIIIDVINREYCKKLIVLLPRQKHPYHYHKLKEETFQVLYGSMEVEREGTPTALHAGDLFLVEPNNWHKFSTLDGVIFEEISTTHYNDDSFYQDQAITLMTREERITRITI